MKNISLKLLFTSIGIAGFLQAYSQIHVTGNSFNNYGYVRTYQQYTEISATAGSSYSAASGSIFDHNDVSSATTLRVNNPYNANGIGGSTDNFNGPSGAPGLQGISGSVAPNLSTLVIKNGTTTNFQLTNTAGVNVFTLANFQNAITTTVRANTGNGALRFQDGATYSGGLSDVQHVDGYVGKVGNDAFVFPVGSSTDSRPLTITPPANIAANITTAYETTNVESAASFQSPVGSVFTNASWDWITATPTDDDGINVTVSMPDVSAFAPTATLRLIGWNGTEWIDLSGTSNASGTTEGSTLAGTIPSGIAITQIGIGSTQNPLPLHLLSFDVSKGKQNDVLISWSTSMESNTDHFEPQRSIDGKTWSKIASITSKGQNNALNDYAYTDTKAQKGLNLYRLKSIDKDGTFTYSPTRSIDLATASTIELYPNPASDKVAVNIPEPNEIQSLKLVSLRGDVINEYPKPQSTSVFFDLSGVASGIYFIKINYTNNTQSTLKFSRL
jgi:hypothetical protein